MSKVRNHVELPLTNGLDSLVWRGTFGSRKIEALVERALGLGLEVHAEITDEDWPGVEADYRSVSLRIHRPRVEPQNMLDVVRNASRISVGYSWIRENGRTPKMYHAIQYGYASDHSLTARTLPYAIDGLAR